MEFEWSADDARFRQELRAFLASELPPDWEGLSKDGPGSDAQLDFSRSFCARLARKGWLTQHWPSAHGGHDATPWRHAVLGEEMWAHGEPRGSQYMNVNWIGPAIMQVRERGPEGPPPVPHLRRRRALVPGLLGAGSGLGPGCPAHGGRSGAEITTVVDGQKIWTSYCNNADYCFLLVRTDPGLQSRSAASRCSWCPWTFRAMEVREIPSVVGERYFHEVFLTDVRVPVECLLGNENEGWEVVTYALAVRARGSGPLRPGGPHPGRHRRPRRGHGAPGGSGGAGEARRGAGPVRSRPGARLPGDRPAREGQRRRPWTPTWRESREPTPDKVVGDAGPRRSSGPTRSSTRASPPRTSGSP